ncbi:ABC1 kinase family protein [Phaeobacter italicus]|uniref:ABC1 kinase family protein n=1 Tax=Phaeobacter italicus TaxID=481446 RepID=UPI000669C3EA|nr:AarF/ABC1/UbiB kinase family protein [Phaeobacter italicus]CRL13491.1 putative ubiquinone biosynthesis protein UbiB [Phaeobacter italicus]SFH56988.1 Predicted unusual protein kinase regulating ubiquinone biosynthesis, AarF/ABC1/UbiB family [Phaeobacter italicus]
MSAKTGKMQPRSVPTGRVSRAFRVGGVAAHLAGQVAVGGMQAVLRGARPSLRELALTPAALGKLTSELAAMRGAAMKLGQLLSMDAGDILPQEFAIILSRLRAEADFMPPRQLKQVLDQNWGEGWQRRFRRFDVRPIAAASIGQVHRAILPDGRDVAVKVQYPGIAQSIDSDLSNIASLLRASRLIPASFDLDPYLQEVRRQLHEEVDYEREGNQLGWFGEQLMADPRFLVPEQCPHLSTDSVLVMRFMQGQPIEKAASAAQSVRDGIMRDLFALFLRELFEFSVMQSDPNFANYLWQKDTGCIVLLDFGATRSLADETPMAYREFLRAGLGLTSEVSLETAAGQLGFLPIDLSADQKTRILAMMARVFDALTTGEAFDFADTSLAQEIQAEGFALMEERVAPPAVPMDVLFVQRKLGGLVLLATKLGARVDLRSLLDPYLGQSSYHSAAE